LEALLESEPYVFGALLRASIAHGFVADQGAQGYPETRALIAGVCLLHLSHW
jgi:hypothetical protein